jgi:hypothetical protein
MRVGAQGSTMTLGRGAAILAVAVAILGGGGFADPAHGSPSGSGAAHHDQGGASRPGRHGRSRVPVPCYAAFPQAHRKTIGKTTWYNRQESVRMVLCQRFGLTPSADFPISAGMVCGMLAAAIDAVPGGQAAHRLSLFADGACSGVELAADPAEPAKYVGIACGWASDLLGALVKPAGVLGSLGCAAAPSAGHALGSLFESKHELDVAIDVMRQGKCIKFSPTHFGSPWLAIRCASGDRGFSGLQLAPPPPPAPPPAPSPQVPSSGPTVVFAGATAMGSQEGDLSFYSWEEATGEDTEVSDALPHGLSSYRCVVLLVNESLEAGDESLLAGYLRSGGTIVAIGEHEGYGFDEADATLNRFAGSLGVGLALEDDELDYGEQVTTSVDSSPFTAGVYALGDNWVSSVSVSGPAQPLVGSSDDSATIVGGQAVGSGHFIMAGDSNMFSDNAYGAYYFYDNGQFVHNLCP